MHRNAIVLYYLYQIIYLPIKKNLRIVPVKIIYRATCPGSCPGLLCIRSASRSFMACHVTEPALETTLLPTEKPHRKSAARLISARRKTLREPMRSSEGSIVNGSSFISRASARSDANSGSAAPRGWHHPANTNHSQELPPSRGLGHCSGLPCRKQLPCSVPIEPPPSYVMG